MSPTPSHSNGYNPEENSERTPLLANGSVATASDPAAVEAVATASSEDRPLPKVQLFLLCYARLVEPIAFFSIFPYINQMVKTNGDLDDADVGFYSGLIESLFSLTGMIVMIFWGRAADKYGRKPVLTFSLASAAVAISTFGFAKSIWQMIVLRCLAGVFTGTVVTIRTMIAEHSTVKTQARAFSWFAFSGNLGIFAGPFLGGVLADPAHQYPGVFGQNKFLLEYPYALPTIATGVIGATAALISAFYIEETLKKPEDSLYADARTPLPSTWEVFRGPGVGIVLFLYGHVMLLAFAYTAILPVVLFTPIRLGGFSCSPLEISLVIGLIGLAQAIWLLAVFPPLQQRIGTGGVVRACSTVYPFVMAVPPILNTLLRQCTYEAKVAFWAIGPLAVALGVGVSMSFEAMQLAVNDVSPSPQTLATLNALALTVVSGTRAFTPAVATTIFAFGARTQVMSGYLAWVVLALLALGFTVATRFLPEKVEDKMIDTTDHEE